jgi:hypothetical protein
MYGSSCLKYEGYGRLARDWYGPTLKRLGGPLQQRMRHNRCPGVAVIHLRASAASAVPYTRTSPGIRKRKTLTACLTDAHAASEGELFKEAL